jgi:hypothetical protein
MTRKTFLQLTSAAVVQSAVNTARAAEVPRILDPEPFRHHVEFFNSMAPEEVVNAISNAQSWEWIERNAPIFTCPDRDVEQIYFFRWWTYRKHIKQTPEGFIVTEFLKPVNHAGDYNSLSCALGHHIAEGRWLHDQTFLDQDIHFWLRTGEDGGLRKNLHQFSGWTAAALYDRYLADGNRDFVVSYLDPLLLDYAAWVSKRMTDTGLFWQRDVSDGMEESISGGRKVKNIRPSINSYMYGNAKAIAAIAKLAGKEPLAREYSDKAARLRDLTLERHWNKDAAFFETLLESGGSANVREAIGYSPWYFGLPPDRSGYEAAWKQLMDPSGFSAPYGPTTAERRSPKFEIAYTGDDCKWNGPNWPFATTVTLRGLANTLNDYHQSAITRDDYFQSFLGYVKTHRIAQEDGRVIPWIDENQNPLTGEWLARAMKIAKKTFYGRGDWYNHSGFADLAITGLAGLRPRPDGVVEVNPLVPTAKWDWFCMDRIPYHGRTVAIVWDKTGTKFGKGKGLRVFADGNQIAHAPELTRVTGK